MISCNHFAITTTCLHGFLQIYCKKRFFHKKSSPTQIAENPQLVEQKPCQSAFSPTFRIRNIQQKSLRKLWDFHSWGGKRESVHLLPTLYIKQLPLPSTILPIRGTLGLFQGVVFESDFCHTNFRTTVAYDKFTNNFWIDKIEERWPLFVATSLRFTEH